MIPAAVVAASGRSVVAPSVTVSGNLTNTIVSYRGVKLSIIYAVIVVIAVRVWIMAISMRSPALIALCAIGGVFTALYCWRYQFSGSERIYIEQNYQNDALGNIPQEVVAKLRHITFHMKRELPSGEEDFGSAIARAAARATRKVFAEEGLQASEGEPRLLGDPERCSVCLCAYVDGDALTVLPCDHGYHKTCLVQWLSSRVTCPLCNQNILELIARRERPLLSPHSADNANGAEDVEIGLRTAIN
jgi:hypothetical protein